MKKNLCAALMLTLSVFLTACAESKSDGDSNIPYFTPEDFSGVRGELQKASFFCAKPSECPSNVGLIYMNLDGDPFSPKVGQCTGFLIAEDVVATNSHCIPDRLRVPGASCEKQIAIRFLNSSGSGVYGCSEILEFSPVSGVDQDYAFFRIPKTGLEPLTIYKGGLKDKENIRVPKVTPFSTVSGGQLEIESCRLALGTLLNPRATNRWSKTGLGLDCGAIGGNSGSPVLNENGQVLGILQGKMLGSYKTTLEENMKQFKVKLPDMVKHMVFTSLSCVADPVTRTFEKDKCAYGDSLNITDCVDLGSEKTEANGKRFYEGWKKELPTIFVYSFMTDEKTLTTTAQPICVKPKSKYADYDLFVSLKGVMGFRKESMSTSYPRAIKVGGRFSIDKDFRLEPELKFVEESRSNFGVELVKEGNFWTGSTFSSSPDWRQMFNLPKSKISMSLPDCTEQQLTAEEIALIETESGDVMTEQEYDLAQKRSEKKVCER